MDVAALIPVKAFSSAKQRLSHALTPAERVRFARWMAEGVVAAVTPMPVVVACDDDEVRDWARSLGADVAWGPGLGLNGAVDDGVRHIARAGFDHVVVSHADLPLPRHLVQVPRQGVTTLVPDRRRDGTNVMSFPTDLPVPASYGGGSFRRHLSAAYDTGKRILEVRTDLELSLDVDTPADLAHPLLSEVLPEWLPTNLANRFTHQRR